MISVVNVECKKMIEQSSFEFRIVYLFDDSNSTVFKLTCCWIATDATKDANPKVNGLNASRRKETLRAFSLCDCEHAFQSDQ